MLDYGDQALADTRYFHEVRAGVLNDLLSTQSKVFHNAFGSYQSDPFVQPAAQILFSSG